MTNKKTEKKTKVGSISIYHNALIVIEKIHNMI